MTKVIFIAFCLILYPAGNALAVEISWMHVQHRDYGNGKSLDRLGFGLIDDGGNYVRNNRRVKDVTLYGLEEKEFKLAPLNFNAVEEIYGTYDARNSQWIYSKAWQFKFQIETKDKNNRTYSKPLTVREIPSISHSNM